jgi:hypothetical protein
VESLGSVVQLEPFSAILIFVLVEWRFFPCWIILSLALGGLLGKGGFFLSIFTLEILVMESIVVSIWRQMGVMKWSMVISNSLHVFWGIDNIWIVWRVVVDSLEAMDSFIGIMEFVPFFS